MEYMEYRDDLELALMGQVALIAYFAELEARRYENGLSYENGHSYAIAFAVARNYCDHTDGHGNELEPAQRLPAAGNGTSLCQCPVCMEVIGYQPPQPAPYIKFTKLGVDRP